MKTSVSLARGRNDFNVTFPNGILSSVQFIEVFVGWLSMFFHNHPALRLDVSIAQGTAWVGCLRVSVWAVHLL